MSFKVNNDLIQSFFSLLFHVIIAWLHFCITCAAVFAAGILAYLFVSDVLPAFVQVYYFVVSGISPV